MDQIKIGKLIAKLRKEKGLTQKELGDMVGVGYRAVSKWERGINLPDSSLYKPLCDIFNITIDELLNGKKENTEIKTKNNKKYKFLIIIPIIIFIALALFLKNKHEVNADNIYLLQTAENEQYIDGKVFFTNGKANILIRKISFNNYELNHTIIKNYTYSLYYENKLIYSFGNNDTILFLSTPISIKKFFQTFTIDYKTYKFTSNDINEIGKLYLKFKFIDINDNVIPKDIPMEIIKQ